MNGERVYVSAVARRLLRVLNENEKGEATMEELAREVRASRTATAHAIGELLDARIIAANEEEEPS